MQAACLYHPLNCPSVLLETSCSASCTQADRDVGAPCSGCYAEGAWLRCCSQRMPGCSCLAWHGRGCYAGALGCGMARRRSPAQLRRSGQPSAALNDFSRCPAASPLYFHYHPELYRSGGSNSVLSLAVHLSLLSFHPLLHLHLVVCLLNLLASLCSEFFPLSMLLRL